MSSKEAVILVGHGGTASDMPRPMIEELKKLEGQRMAKGILEMSPREKELDDKVRNWPRTPATDAYKFGIEKIADALRVQLPAQHVTIAYNEFCAPSVEGAIETLVNEGYQKIVLVVTMFTQGGIHSECEIPMLVDQARKKHPGVSITYAWPFDVDFAAKFLADQVNKFQGAPLAR